MLSRTFILNILKRVLVKLVIVNRRCFVENIVERVNDNVGGNPLFEKQIETLAFSQIFPLLYFIKNVKVHYILKR